MPQEMREAKETPVTFEIIRNPEFRQVLRDRLESLKQFVEEHHPNTLVFLDKSARPLSWLLRELWKQSPQQQAHPEIRFVNIGTSSSFFKSPNEKEMPQHLEEIASRFRQTFGTTFSNQDLIIIDDVKSTGRSLRLAQQSFLTAFPDARSVRSAALFQEQEVTEMPWMRVEGANDVLEFDDAVFASALSQENVQKKFQELSGHVLERVKEASPAVQGVFFQKELAEVATEEEQYHQGSAFLEFAQHPSLSKYKGEIEGAVTAWETLWPRFAAKEMTQEEALVLVSNFLQLREHLEGLAIPLSALTGINTDRETKRLGFQAIDEIRLLLQQGRPLFDKVRIFFPEEEDRKEFRQISFYRSLQGDTEALQKLVANAQQLRKEIAAIAKLPTSHT